ncbi:MAG: 30S ribosome-binding factor RbfA [Candidatus Midichloria sp.]|uniref:30S ribosome-binding factor RbfA n=1 Tax=Hyalomma marginatum TaxID=34627 RepID=A0A8S4C2E9_9ACAR|nr:30S ribosome-binding factor RbfA [Hyalomma marginatum]CAG7593863.1 30S ribosome-binding factor RbfA [Hyalomma marginatum]
MNLLYSKQPTQRQLVIASSIQQVVSKAFVTQEIYHPNLEEAMMVFPFVKITADLKIATIYVDCLNKDKIKGVLEILKSLTVEIRKLIANKLKLRYAPEIRFIEDTITPKQSNLLRLLDNIS